MSTLFSADTPLRPSAARISNYLLHGKDHFAADRQVAEKLLDQVPGLRGRLHQHRDFVTRAAVALASLGFDRFADLGCGLPPDFSMLRAVRDVQPQASLVFVDIDPYATAHFRALVATDDRTEVLTLDARDTPLLLKHARMQDMLTDDSHAVVVAAGLLQFMDDEDAAQLIATWHRELPPAGRLLVSHLCSDHSTPEHQLDALRRAYAAAETTIHVRTASQFAALFGDGWTWTKPGLVPVDQWRPHHTAHPILADSASRSIRFYGGVAIPDPEKVA
ncbi:SAM-dependent methyltransferase [Nonomuraea ceibae]|uniref:SAM-dependent methyltransferase n=1 Tax=Nonomuraea ceibae TaxID=1935170 RepID=UPI001C5FC557|nr:SAM-dependent methyltransferase [Nonomuraea ceibae]